MAKPETVVHSPSIKCHSPSVRLLSHLWLPGQALAVASSLVFVALDIPAERVLTTRPLHPQSQVVFLKCKPHPATYRPQPSPLFSRPRLPPFPLHPTTSPALSCFLCPTVAWSPLCLNSLPHNTYSGVCSDCRSFPHPPGRLPSAVASLCNDGVYTSLSPPVQGPSHPRGFSWGLWID